MPSSPLITFLTIIGGPLLTAAFYVCYVIACRRITMPFTMFVGLLANATSVVPLACILAGIVSVSYNASFPPALATGTLPASPARQAAVETVAMSLSGSEVTLFLALLYALIMIFYMVFRTISEVIPAKEATTTAPTPPPGG
jgi:hypothetical protein